MEDTISIFKLKYESGESINLLKDFVDNEFKKLLSYIGNLKVWTFGTREFKFEDNLLLSPLPKDYTLFLYRAIAGLIISRGHTYIYGGSDYTEIKRLLLTLSLFLEEPKRRLCTNLYATNINPYLCLQVVNDKEINELMEITLKCRWPTCIIDVRKKKVFVTGMYWDHLKRQKTIVVDEKTKLTKK